MAYRVFLADDEPLICSELRYILEHEKDVEVVGECHMGSKVIENIRDLKPHVLFLDINMPGSTGIEIARNLLNEKRPPYIVFVTAYEEYAIEAFRVNAVGYVLKPFMAEEIKDVMKQVRARMGQRSEYIQRLSRALEEIKTPGFKRIAGERDGRLCLIDPEDINVIIIREKTTHIVTDQGEYLANQSLMNLEGKLETTRHFFRSHRNYLVNLKKVKEVLPWFNGTYLLVVGGKEKKEIPVSRYRVRELKELLGI